MQEIWSQLCIEHTQASSANRIESIQSLWSGYGEIFRVQLVPEELGTVVVKQVCPPQTKNSNPTMWKRIGIRNGAHSATIIAAYHNV